MTIFTTTKEPIKEPTLRVVYSEEALNDLGFEGCLATRQLESQDFSNIHDKYTLSVIRRDGWIGDDEDSDEELPESVVLCEGWNGYLFEK